MCKRVDEHGSAAQQRNESQVAIGRKQHEQTKMLDSLP